MTTNLQGGKGKALVVGPLTEDFFAASLSHYHIMTNR